MGAIERGYQYLESMPVAIAILKVEKKNQYEKSLSCVYINHAFEELEGIAKEKIMGEKFHSIFHNTEEEWIKIYSRTAYDGTPQVLTEYSMELNKFLEISTYQPEDGYCACIIKDRTKEMTMKHNMGVLQKKMDIIISKTTDVIFDFDLERNIITNSEISIRHFKVKKYVSNVPEGLVKENLLKEEYLEEFRNLIKDLRQGKEEGSIEIEMRLTEQEEFHWYRLTLCSYYQDFEQQLRVVGFMRNITDEVIKRRLLEEKASHDDLTGLYNRYGGISKIQEIIIQQEECKREEEIMPLNAMFLLDLDNFKQANDQYGHERGDSLLVHFANILRESFRQNDIIIRLGGDEFIIFAPQVNKEEANKICQRVLDNNKMEELQKLGVSVRVGVVIGNSKQYDTYYRNADQAMYVVKRKKKNGYYVIEKMED